MGASPFDGRRGWSRLAAAARSTARPSLRRLARTWQAIQDKLLGTVLLSLSLLIFVYYTLWVVVTVRAASEQEEFALVVASSPSSPSSSPHARPTLPCARPALLRGAQPFVDASHFVQAFFPDRKYGVMLPAVLLVLLIVVAGTFVGAVMYSTKKANKTK